MGRITWVCATCPEHFTRKYSASRHNNNLHFGNGLIVTLLDYIVGRVSGQYLPSDPRTSKNHNPLIHDYTPRWPSKPVSQASYSMGIMMLGLLAQRFFSWFKSSRNPVVLLYGLSSFLPVNITTSQ